MIFTGRFGQLCACAPPHAAHARTAPISIARTSLMPSII
jgi:hypothetical protein